MISRTSVRLRVVECFGFTVNSFLNLNCANCKLFEWLHRFNARLKKTLKVHWFTAMIKFCFKFKASTWWTQSICFRYLFVRTFFRSPPLRASASDSRWSHPNTSALFVSIRTRAWTRRSNKQFVFSSSSFATSMNLDCWSKWRSIDLRTNWNRRRKASMSNKKKKFAVLFAQAESRDERRVIAQSQ